jgi:Zn-dependent protease
MNPLFGRLGNGPRLMRVAGIDVRVDWSWFLVAALILMNFSTLLTATGASAPLAFLGSLLAIALFFGTVLIHELAHALVARQGGIGTRAISLHLLGGMAQLTGEPRSGRQEMAIAGAGPLINIVAGVALGLPALLLPSGGGLLGVLGTVLAWAAGANVLLGFVNLLPAFPLDGGRVLRGILWHRHRSFATGTLRAARIGRGTAWVVLVLGMLALAFRGDLWMALMLGFLGYLMLQGSDAEARRAAAPMTMGDPLAGARAARNPFEGLRGLGRRGRVVQRVRYPDGRIVEIFER